jgi:hypothetical protein
LNRSIGIAATVAILLFGGAYLWLSKSGADDAAEIAKSCGIPTHHVRYGTIPKSSLSSTPINSFKGIWLDSNYAWCPPPERDAAIACARKQAARRSQDFAMELAVGDCERFGAME